MLILKTANLPFEVDFRVEPIFLCFSQLFREGFGFVIGAVGSRFSGLKRYVKNGSQELANYQIDSLALFGSLRLLWIGVLGALSRGGEPSIHVPVLNSPTHISEY